MIKTFDEIYIRQLREATYKWNIDPDDRAWFISPEGKIISDMSHRIMLKQQFPNEWNKMRQKMEDGDIEEVLTNRLIMTGWIKIGELNTFYANIYKLTGWVKDVLFSFTTSILKVKNVKNMDFIIFQKEGPKIVHSIEEIANDILF